MWCVDVNRTSWDQSFYFILHPYLIFMFEWKKWTVQDDKRITKGKKNIFVVLVLDSLWPPCPDAPASCWSFERGRPCRGFHAGRCKPRLRTPLSSGLCLRRCETPPKSPPDKLKRQFCGCSLSTLFRKLTISSSIWKQTYIKDEGNEDGWCGSWLPCVLGGCCDLALHL